MPPWSPSQSEQVERLWRLGWTGAQIARELGLTRNQVLSKVRRLQLTRALRFADEVAAFGCVEKAAKAVGVSARKGQKMMTAMKRQYGWQAN